MVRTKVMTVGLRRRTRACQLPDERGTECRERLTAVKIADGLKRRERKVQ